MKSVRQPYRSTVYQQALAHIYWHTSKGNGIFILMESEPRSETISTSQFGTREIKSLSETLSESHGARQAQPSADLRINNSLEMGDESTNDAQVSPAQTDYRLPKTLLGSLSLLAGFPAGVALIMPALCGGVLGWWVTGKLDYLGLGLTLISYFALMTGFIILSEFSDYRFCQRPESKYVDSGNHLAGANLISTSYFQADFVISAGILFLLIGLLSNLILAVTIASWPVLFFFAICALLLAIYMVPPPWHGYFAWGIGELGIVAGVGVLPLVSSYYVQRGMVDSLSLFLGVSLGTFAVLVLFSRTLIRQRRDWMVRKRTLAVVLGEKRSSNFLIVCIVTAYASLLLVVTITSLPLLLLLGLTTLPIAIGHFKEAEEVLQTATERHDLYQLQIKAMLYTSLLLIGLLVLERVW